MVKSLLTANRLRALLDYDPATGLFRWRVSTGTVGTGNLAGTLHRNGYCRISIDGVRYAAHRLAFLWMTGTWPALTIDHADGARANNCWLNLREATRAQQMQNSKIKRGKKSRYKGVHWHSRNKHWVACINNKHIGSSKHEHTAYLMYCRAAIKQFGKFARLT